MFDVGGGYEEVFDDAVREIALVVLSDELHVILQIGRECWVKNLVAQTGYQQQNTSEIYQGGSSRV